MYVYNTSHATYTRIMSHAPLHLCLGDQMVLYYDFSHKSMKWWKRVFYCMLVLALVNAHILHLMSGNRLTQLEFRQEVVKGLLEGFQRQRANTTPRAPDTPLWLTETRPFQHPWEHGLTAEFAVIGGQESDIRRNIVAKAAKHPCVPIPAWRYTIH